MPGVDLVPQVFVAQQLFRLKRINWQERYDYPLMDVLQRVGQHPAARVAELTPRLWKQHFADNPLRSDLDARSAVSAARAVQ